MRCLYPVVNYQGNLFSHHVCGLISWLSGARFTKNLMPDLWQRSAYAGRRTYAELVNCERLTKKHKLNLRQIYAKLTQNLGKTYDHINAVIT